MKKEYNWIDGGDDDDDDDVETSTLASAFNS
jgi:hypothetical protein